MSRLVYQLRVGGDTLRLCDQRRVRIMQAPSGRLHMEVVTEEGEPQMVALYMRLTVDGRVLYGYPVEDSTIPIELAHCSLTEEDGVLWRRAARSVHLLWS
jgi:hypothetical protein